MAQVYVSIGSNMEPERHIRAAVRSLRARYGTLVLSRVYETEAVGFEGADFLNLAAGFATAESPGQVVRALRAIEDAAGRERGPDRFAPRTLDIDLLLYDDVVLHTEDLELPRDEIRRYAFVLGPLAEIAGDHIHPQTGTSIARLWREFDAREQPMHAIDLSLD